MACTPELTEIVCPRCGEEFATWDQQALAVPTELVCPRCGMRPARDLRIREDGFWDQAAAAEELRLA